MFYSLAFAMMCAATPAAAQNEKTYDFEGTMFNLVNKDGTYTEEVMVGGILNHVSGNGEYAVGYDDQGLTSNNGAAFLWRKSNPDQVEIITPTFDRVGANDVSNDGIIVGSFEMRSNSDTRAFQFPGYKHVDDTHWTPLEVPTQYSNYFGQIYDFAEEARAITPDGSTIAGNFHYRWGEKEVLGTMTDLCQQAVTIWDKYGDGYKLRKCYTDLGKAGNAFFYNKETKQFDPVTEDVNYQTFLVRDISNDGKTVVGMNVADCGGFNPAFVRDGKLYQLFDCGETVYGEDPENPEPVNNFNGGTIFTIDTKGNMYGYFTEEDGMTTRGFIFTAENELIMDNTRYMCADANGNKYTQVSHGLNPLFDCSEDGTVLVGAGIGSLGGGMSQYNYPKVTIVEGGQGTNIENTTAEKQVVKVDFQSGVIKVIGNYLYANVYSADGVLIKGGNRGASLDISNFPTGTYVVKVATMTGVETFKVAK